MPSPETRELSGYAMGVKPRQRASLNTHGFQRSHGAAIFRSQCSATRISEMLPFANVGGSKIFLVLLS
jgi:hypothetical protein